MGAVIYSGDVEDLNGHAPFGDGECVALVQSVTSVGPTSRWRPGPRVVDLSYLNPGTVIANFVNGRFPNRHKFHAALFIGFTRGISGKVTSIRVMDQFKGRMPKNSVKARDIQSRGDKSYRDGNRYSDCDNADQFYVVVIQ
jgi:hypothetical protein